MSYAWDCCRPRQRGNQAEVLDTKRREALSGAEVKGVVDLWPGCADRTQQQYILGHPSEALSQAKGITQPGRDPRLPYPNFSLMQVVAQ